MSVASQAGKTDIVKILNDHKVERNAHGRNKYPKWGNGDGV